MNTYCGNNRLEPSVLNGSRRIGTRTECLKKGFGVGLSLPRVDNPYEAIDDRSYYCGNRNTLPRNYDLMGSPSICLRKGIGAGRASSTNTPFRRFVKWAVRVLLVLLVAFITHLIWENHVYTALSAVGSLVVLFVVIRYRFVRFV